MTTFWRRRNPAASADLLLVQRVLGGDREAARELFDQIFPRLYRFALRRVGGNADLAEEVVQASLLHSVSHLESYRGEATLFTWICSICRNEIHAHQRRGQIRHQILFEESPEVRAALASLTSLDDPAFIAERKELGEMVRIVLDNLLPRHCRALEWKYFENLTAGEIGQRLGIGVKAAEVLLVRARRSFREGFEGLLLAGPYRERSLSS